MPTNIEWSEMPEKLDKIFSYPTKDLSHFLNIYRILFRCLDERLSMRMRACINDRIATLVNNKNHNDKLILSPNNYCGIQNEVYGKFDVILYTGAKPYSLIAIVPDCMLAFPFRSYPNDTSGYGKPTHFNPWFYGFPYNEHTYCLQRTLPEPFKLKKATDVYEAIQWYERFQLLPNIFRSFRPYKLLKSVSMGGKTIESSDRFYLFRSSFDPYIPIVYKEQEGEYYKNLGNNINQLVPLWIRFCVPTYTVEFIYVESGKLVTTTNAKINIPKSLWDKAITKYINGDMVMNSLSPQASIPANCEEVGFH